MGTLAKFTRAYMSSGSENIQQWSLIAQTPAKTTLTTSKPISCLNSAYCAAPVCKQRKKKRKMCAETPSCCTGPRRIRRFFWELLPQILSNNRGGGSKPYKKPSTNHLANRFSQINRPKKEDALTSALLKTKKMKNNRENHSKICEKGSDSPRTT